MFLARFPRAGWIEHISTSGLGWAWRAGFFGFLLSMTAKCSHLIGLAFLIPFFSLVGGFRDWCIFTLWRGFWERDKSVYTSKHFGGCYIRFHDTQCYFPIEARLWLICWKYVRLDIVHSLRSKQQAKEDCKAQSLHTRYTWEHVSFYSDRPNNLSKSAAFSFSKTRYEL